MNDAYRVMRNLKDKPTTGFAMATIVAVEGSAYRHVGAKMLIAEDGVQYGTISAGCLEEDLAHHAGKVIETHESETLVYDLRSTDDLSWGQGAGCNGSIRVFVEYCVFDEATWSRVDALLNCGSDVARVKSMSVATHGATEIFCSPSRAVVGAVDAELLHTLLPATLSFLDSGRDIALLARPEAEFLLERYRPRDQLFIFGAGPDVEPLARLATGLDFLVTIIDPRSSRCTAKLFPTADKLCVVHPETFLDQTAIPDSASVLVMTHSFERDKNILHHFLAKPPRFLGILGPKRRTESLLAPMSLPDWIRSPLGLAIGAEGPDEISISILAQLLESRSRTLAHAGDGATVFCFA